MVVVVSAVGCARKPAHSPEALTRDEAVIHARSRAEVAPVTYAFASLDAREVSSRAHRGKPVVMAFVATGDIVGQAVVNYLVAMAKNDSDKVHYAVVALHSAREKAIVEAYAGALQIPFPVAMSDVSVMNGGPFGPMAAVPTLVVIDEEGRVVWSHTGMATAQQIRSHMPLVR